MVTIAQPALSTDQRTFYHENGYLLVAGLISPAEAAEYRRECHDLAMRLSANASLESTWKSARDVAGGQGDTMLLGCHNVQFYAAAFSRLIVDERLTAVAAALIDSPGRASHPPPLPGRNAGTCYRSGRQPPRPGRSVAAA